MNFNSIPPQISGAPPEDLATLFAAAYGDSLALEKMTESVDDRSLNITTALTLAGNFLPSILSNNLSILYRQRAEKRDLSGFCQAIFCQAYLSIKTNIYLVFVGKKYEKGLKAWQYLAQF
ncbi:MAG: hypothetical protein LBJ14_02965 [Desulfarculales bacterium]|jgi:hypothetical protein|nr:hypothetical protein [Desulfarculales bacterium]